MGNYDADNRKKKAGGGINGEGIFDVGKILLKKALNSNLLLTG